MKKITSLFLALVMCLGLCVPAFASETTGSDVDRPDWVAEDEIWHPANSIMPRDEQQSCAKGHYPPPGYVFQGYTEGNSLVEGFVANGLLNLIGLVPGLGTITMIVSTASAGANLLYAIQHDGRTLAHYFKYVYSLGMTAWNHVIWTYKDDGVLRVLDCSATLVT